MGNIRITMDTPANPMLSPYVYAILLPNAGAGEAEIVRKRLVSTISGINAGALGGQDGRTVTIVINDTENVTAAQVMDIAADALVASTEDVKIIEL